MDRSHIEKYKSEMMALYGKSKEPATEKDEEKYVGDGVWFELKAWLEQRGLSCFETDLFSDERITKVNRKECVRKKMQEFSDAELVITDRLHGMIFSALTGTPCVVFSNYNHKVKGTYEWIKYLPYIRYVESVREAKGFIPELLSMKNCTYDNAPLMPYFDRLATIVRDKADMGSMSK